VLGRGRRQVARAAVTKQAANGLEKVIADAVNARLSGVALTPDELPIVVACRDLIANTIGQLPMIAYRGNQPRPDQPAVVVRPDPFEPRWQTLHRLTNNLTGWGHVWLIPTAQYANDYPAAVQVVDASRAHATFDPTGRLESVYYDGRRLEPGATGAILIPWRVPQAGSLGRAPLADCWRAAEYLAALYDMAGSFWMAGFPSIAVMVKQALNPTQTRELKDQVLGAWARRHEPAVIDRDGSLSQVGSSAVESQLVESIAVANTEIARAFGVMPSLVNVAAGDSLTYATTEGEFSKWLKVGLGQYLSRIEAAFSDLTPYGTEVRFDTTELLRTDLEARWNAYAIGVQNGWILPAEVREREGFPPLPAGAQLAPPAPLANMLADPPAQTAQTGRTAMTRQLTVARAAATLTAGHVGIVRRAPVVAGDDASRTIAVCLVPWGEVARVTDDGRSFYDESWTPGSLSPADLVAVFDGHRPTPAGVERGPLIGRAADLEDRPDGLYATLTLADTAAGRDAYALARTMGAVHVSIEADVQTSGADGGSIVRSATDPGVLTGVAICWPPSRGAFAGAVGAARAQATPVEPDVPPADPDDPDAPVAPDEVISRAEVADLVRTAVARYGLSRAVGQTVSPLSRYQTFDELHAAVRAAGRDEAQTLSRQFADAYTAHRAAVRALVNQITTDNPGVIPPAWLTDTFGIVDRGRPAITALGGPRSPGTSGMDVHWPYYDGDLTAIVGEQVVEKTEIVSVLVSFKRGQATLKTYAGGSDVSYQLQRRSSPSYMSLYDRILQIAYGITTENAFVDALVAGAGHTMVLGDPITAPLGDIKSFLFGASAHVRTVTGAPASAVIVSSDVFAAWGALDNLWPTQYGTQNTAGTADAASLRVNVNGLEITEAPMAPAGTVLVTNEQAAAWLEEGPFLATSEDVSKLGTDVAIWGMGCPGLFLPEAVVKSTAVAGTAAGRGRTADKS